MQVAEQIKVTADGASPSFETLFNQNWERVVIVLARLVGDADEAEDLALEVFYKLHLQMDRISSERIKDGWLYRVAVNLGLNALRAGNRRKQYEQAAGIEDLRGQMEKSPAVEVEARETSHQVQEVFGRMKPRSAKLLALTSAGLSYREIAQTLQIRTSSVGTLINRAEKEFEKRYRERFGEIE